MRGGPDKKKYQMYKLLCNDQRIKAVFKPIEKPSKCCIKLYPKKSPDIKFEIGIYKRNGHKKLYFGIEDQWKFDNKDSQMKFVKDKMADDNNIRKIIMFVKFFVDLNPMYKNIFKSIIILELIVQNHDTYGSIGDNMILALITAERKLRKKFVLNVSGNSRQKENLLDNNFRKVDEYEFLTNLKNLINDFILLKYNESLLGTSICERMTHYHIPDWNIFYAKMKQLFSEDDFGSLYHFMYGHLSCWFTYVEYEPIYNYRNIYSINTKTNNYEFLERMQ